MLRSFQKPLVDSTLSAVQQRVENIQHHPIWCDMVSFRTQPNVDRYLLFTFYYLIIMDIELLLDDLLITK